jgi:hypothetical protein
MALDTVSDYIASARRLLLDEIDPYRYPSADIVDALNMGVQEMVRLRPDLFFKAMRSSAVPAYSSGSTSTAVSVDYRYRGALLYYIVGMMQLRDDETTQDTRAGAFIQRFVAQVATLQ